MISLVLVSGVGLGVGDGGVRGWWVSGIRGQGDVGGTGNRGFFWLIEML